MVKTCERPNILICIGLALLLYYFYGKYWSYLESNFGCGHAPDSVSVPISKIMSGEPIQLQQNDEGIIKYIWENGLIEQPSNAPYNIDKPDVNPSMGQGQLIQKLLKNMTGGFFIEAGALDGETRSNTLFLEMHLGWKGLLVEGDPSNYASVQQKHRKAWISNTCLAIKPYPHQAEYMKSWNIGKIITPDIEPDPGNKFKEVVKVQCMPVFSLLSALKVTTVDYFSLDVEGAELKVLKTIPFQDVLIKLLSVEFAHTNEGKDSLLEFMESQGYKKIDEVTHPGWLANDFIFAHNSILSTLEYK